MIESDNSGSDKSSELENVSLAEMEVSKLSSSSSHRSKATSSITTTGIRKRKVKEGTNYQRSHKLDYAVEPSSFNFHNKSKVEGAKCMFCCKNNGVKEDDGKTRKRAKTSRIKIFKSFTPYLYTNHHENMHKVEWNKYQMLSEIEKQEYFEEDRNESITTNSVVNYFDSDTGCMNIYVHKSIIDVLFYDVLLTDILENPISKEKALALFKRDDFEDNPKYPEDNQEEHFYMVKIKNPSTFSLAISYVANGLSFKQVQSCILATKECFSIAKISGFSRGQISQMVGIVAASNLESLRVIISTRWAFSIAFDPATHKAIGYLDVRIRFEFAGVMFDFHLMAIPLKGTHTGLNMYEHIVKVIEIICPEWKQKLIGASTDGANSMTGRIQGTITRLLADVESGKYRIWCALHQVDLTMQEGYEIVGDGRFIKETTAVISHLRRQYNLIEDMGCTCPLLSLTRWLSLGLVLVWFINKRARIRAYYELSAHASKPNLRWWVTAFYVENLTRPVRDMVSTSQAGRLIVSQCQDRLQKLTNDLQTMSGAVGPFETVEAASTWKGSDGKKDLYIEGKYGIDVTLVQQFVNNNASLFIQESLGLMEEQDKTDMYRELGLMTVTIIDGISKVRCFRDELGQAVYEKQDPCLPHELVCLNNGQFAALLSKHKTRLQHFEREAPCALPKDHSIFDVLEIDFRNLVADSIHDEFVIAELLRISNLPAGDRSFRSCWGHLAEKYKWLMFYCGGLASPFPHNATVESDFSVLRWEKDDHREGLGNVSLEGILHCKSFNEIQSIVSLCF